MQSKDSKKFKNNNNQNNNSSTNNKHLEDNILINKLIPKNKNSKIITNNNSNSNILKTKNQESKVNTSNFNQNKISKNSINVEKEKKTKNIHIPINTHEKNNEKKIGKIIKQKTPNKAYNIDKTKKPKITKKTGIYESKKKSFIKSKTLYDDKRKKGDNNSYRLKKEKKEKKKQNDVKDNGFNTQKLLEFLISLSPIDTSKCDDLISNNMNKIIELENKIAEISKNTEIEILKIINDENNNGNKITTKQNLEIINIESNMRKDIYKLFFNFITELLEQINKLSNNIANQEINDLNFKDSSSNNDNLFINNSNNVSDMSYNSLFVSNIEEEFCEKLINITKSFIGSDIDLLDLKSNFDIDDKNKKNENDLFFNEEDNKVIDNNSNDYNCILKSRSKKIFMIHPNEILNKF